MPSHVADVVIRTVLFDKYKNPQIGHMVTNSHLLPSPGSGQNSEITHAHSAAKSYPPILSHDSDNWNYKGYKWDYHANTKTARIIYRSGNELRRIDIGPKGINAIPDIKAVFRANLEEPDSATWIAITDVSTGGDIATPPICNFALHDGDSSTELIYTGGNHADSGGAWGNPTGRNIAFSFLPDGVEIANDESGVATQVYFLIVNRVQAANTMTLQRETMEQRGLYQFDSGVFLTHIIWTALEPVNVVTDNGPQVITTGFRDGTFKFCGGDYIRSVFTSVTDSGEKASFPDVWGVAFNDAKNGELIVWMDREYGAGDGRYVGAKRPMIRGGGAFNTKFYNAAVSIPDTELTLETGESYEWRGGYVYRSTHPAFKEFNDIVPNRCLQSANRFVKFTNFTLSHNKDCARQKDRKPATEFARHTTFLQFFNFSSMKLRNFTRLLSFIGFSSTSSQSQFRKCENNLELTQRQDNDCVREHANPLLISGWGSSSMWLARQQIADMFSKMIPGSTFFKGCNSGAFSDEIAGRLGSVPLLISIANRKIAKSGTTKITISNCQIRAGFQPFTGTLNGIQGTISCNRSGFIFTREKSGNTVFSPDEYPFISELGNFFKHGVMLLWMGKNDLSKGMSPDDVIAKTDASFHFHTPLHTRCLVMGHFVDTNTPDNDRRRRAIYQVNAAYKVKYGNLFVDIQQFVTSQEWWRYTGLTPTKEDLELQTRGNKPLSGSRDAGHLDDTGSAAITAFLKDHIKSLGWFE